MEYINISKKQRMWVVSSALSQKHLYNFLCVCYLYLTDFSPHFFCAFVFCLVLRLCIPLIWHRKLLLCTFKIQCNDKNSSFLCVYFCSISVLLSAFFAAASHFQWIPSSSYLVELLLCSASFKYTSGEIECSWMRSLVFLM